MTRPDFERMRREADYLYAGAGESVTWRKWVSAGVGAAQYGVQPQNYYVETSLTGLLKNYDPHLAAYQGGQAQTDALYITLPVQMGARDELIYNGSAYPETFGVGRVMYSHPLKLANITG